MHPHYRLLGVVASNNIIFSRKCVHVLQVSTICVALCYKNNKIMYIHTHIQIFHTASAADLPVQLQSAVSAQLQVSGSFFISFDAIFYAVVVVVVCAECFFAFPKKQRKYGEAD